MTAAEEKEIMNAMESREIHLERPSRKFLSDLKKAFDHTLKEDFRSNPITNKSPVLPRITQNLTLL